MFSPLSLFPAFLLDFSLVFSRCLSTISYLFVFLAFPIFPLFSFFTAAPIPYTFLFCLSYLDFVSTLSKSLFLSTPLATSLSRDFFLSPAFFSSLPSRSYLSILVFSAKSLSKTRRFLLLSSSVFFLSLSPTIRLPSSHLLSHLPSFLHVFRFLSSSAISFESPLFRRIIIPLSSVSSLNLSRGLNFFPNTPHTLSVTCFLFPPLNFASSLLPHFSLLILSLS